MNALSEARIQEELRQAMKNRAAVEVAVLRGLLAAIKNATIERRSSGGGELAEAEIVQIVRREIKQREEAIEFAEQAKRADLVEKNQAERDVLRGFLPKEVDRQELRAAIARHHESGATTIGALMGKLKSEFGARLDGRIASELIRDFLKEKGGA
ncbi:MAG: GatB/YqeY domain-containing protein [Candidatus Binatia bacterium]